MANRNQFITFIIPAEDTDLLAWYNQHKARGVNMSALMRDTLRKGIIKGEPPEWFLNWLKDNNGVQPSISEQKIDLGGLFDD